MFAVREPKINERLAATAVRMAENAGSEPPLRPGADTARPPAGPVAVSVTRNTIRRCALRLPPDGIERRRSERVSVDVPCT